jgi:Tfp pilus assembly protein PilF
MSEADRKQQALQLCRDAYQHQLRGDYAEAIEFYTKSIEVYPTAEAYTFRGWVYQMLGRVDDAIAECHKAIEIDDTFGNPYNDIGAYLIAKGNLDDAVEWLEKAKRAPRYEPRHFPYMNLGHLYASKGMMMQAIHELETALSIAPGEPTCLEMLAQIKSKLN